MSPPVTILHQDGSVVTIDEPILWVWKSLSHVQLFATPLDYIVHGILQTRILEWVAVPFSSGSSSPGIKPRSPALQADSLSAEPPGKHLRIFQRACSNSDSWAVPSGSLTQLVRDVQSLIVICHSPFPPQSPTPSLPTVDYSICDLPTVCSWPWASAITQVR